MGSKPLYNVFESEMDVVLLGVRLGWGYFRLHGSVHIDQGVLVHPGPRPSTTRLVRNTASMKCKGEDLSSGRHFTCRGFVFFSRPEVW